MKGSRINKMLAGIFIIFAGFGLFLDQLGFMNFNPFPLIILYFGLRFWTNNRRILGGILIAIGASVATESWFEVEIFELIFPIGVIYLGFRLLRSRPARNQEHPLHEETPTVSNEVQPKPPRSYQAGQRYYTTNKSGEGFAGANQMFSPNESRSSLIGDFHLTSGRFEMQNLHIWHGIGNVVIDLSRALLPEEETFLVVNGWIGDVTIYVPIDLPVAVAAEVTLGDLEVLGARQGGLNRNVNMSAQHYESSSKKVKIIISLIVGDIDVKYI